MATYNIANHQPMAGSHEAISATTGGVVTLTASKYATTTVFGHNSGGTPIPQTVIAEDALITVTGNAIRWTVDGTDPTTGATGTGHDAAVADVIILEGFDAIRRFKAIGQTGTGVLHVTYFRN